MSGLAPRSMDTDPQLGRLLPGESRPCHNPPTMTQAMSMHCHCHAAAAGQVV